MIEEQHLTQLERQLHRLFSLHTSRLTLRELQNVLLATVQGDRDLAIALFDTLLSGQIKPNVVKANLTDQLNKIIHKYTFSVRLAKEVFERGDFLNLIVSDLMTNPQEESAFVHRIRKVDGEEFLFVTDPPSMIHLLQHFIARFEEFKSHPQSKAFFEQFDKEWKQLSQKVAHLGRPAL